METFGTVLSILLERIMELLALYLILANMSGRNLKEAWRYLVRDKQRILYENIVLFIGYVLMMVFLVYWSRATGYFIVGLIQPFIALFLVRSWNIKMGLVGYIALIMIGVIIAAITAFMLHPIVNFSLILFLAIGAVYRDYFYKVYHYLAKKRLWLNLVCMISFVILYVLPFPFDTHQLPFVGLFLFLLILFNYLTNKGIEKALAKTIELIDNSSYEELLLFLEKSAYDYNRNELVECYVIREKVPFSRFIDALSQKLEMYKQVGIIEGYHCKVRNEQIKISIFL